MQDKEASKSKTKVCYIITKGNWGGAQKYVYSLATSIPKDTHEVCVVVGAGGILKNKLDTAGIKTFELKSLKRDISLIREIKSFFEIFMILIKERPEVLHLNSPKASGLGALAGRLLFIKKIVTTVHGFTFNEDRGAVSKILIYFFSWITILMSHKTIVIAPQEERQALAMPFVSSKKIILIKNGVEQINFKERGVAREELLKISDKKVAGDAVWIGTISELHKNKGLEYAIKALCKVKSSFVFFVLGGGEEEQNLQSLIEKNNLQDKVFLVGFLEKAPEYLKAFDIFTLTSLKEGLPYSLLEAGQAGLPVVASNIGGIPDIIDNSKNGILVGKTRDGEITRGLEYLIANPEKRTEFGINLKTRVEKEFSVEQMLKKTEELYK